MAETQWTGNSVGSGEGQLGPQSNHITWVHVVDVDILNCHSQRRGGEADRRMTAAALEAT